MADAGLCATVQVVHGELATPSLPPRLFAVQERLERDGLVALPGAVRRAKVRDAALGGDPGAREPDHPGRPVHHSSQQGNLVGHDPDIGRKAAEGTRLRGRMRIEAFPNTDSAWAAPNPRVN